LCTNPRKNPPRPRARLANGRKIEDEEEDEDENENNYQLPIKNHKSPNHMKKIIPHLTHLSVLAYLTLTAGLVATSGCTVLTYTAPTGEHFTRGSLGANTSISSLAIEAGTNGVRRVELRGYQNDSSQALSAVTEAAVKAAIESAK